MDPQAARTADPVPSNRPTPAKDGAANTAGPSGPKAEQKRGSYSRFVTLMKICRPAGALALAGLVVLWPQMQVGDKGFRPGVASVGPKTPIVCAWSTPGSRASTKRPCPTR